MTPVIDRSTRMLMGPFDNPTVLTDDLPLRRDDDPLRVEPHADRPVGEGGRHAIAIALDVDQASRWDSLALLDEAIERSLRHHQARAFGSPDVGDGARKTSVQNSSPLFNTTLLQPGV